MKKIKLSFNISIVLNQTDFYFIWEKFIKKREDIFLKVLEKVLLKLS